VRVHYNSPKPAQLQTLAYTQGNQVHIAPGQERHLGHELGHVVQQKQGRVRATGSIGGMTVNDDAGLEKETVFLGSDKININKQLLNLRQKIRPVIQLQYNYQNEFTGPSIGVEQEASKYRVICNRVYRGIIAEIKSRESNEVLILITTDMGNEENGYTLEIITTPIEMSNAKGLNFRKAAITYFFTYLQMTSDIDTVSLTESENEQFILKPMRPPGTIRIKKESDFLNFSNQITLGVETKKMEQILIENSAMWFEKGKYSDTKIENDIAKILYNYTICILLNLAEIFSNNTEDVDIYKPEIKNAWNILPRTPPIKAINSVLGDEDKKLVKTCISKFNKPDNFTHIKESAFKKAKECIFDGTPLAKTSLEGKISGEHSSVFEIRSPNPSWDKYLWDSIELSKEPKPKINIRKMDAKLFHNSPFLQAIEKYLKEHPNSDDEEDETPDDDW
jgi:hypothetical protein